MPSTPLSLGDKTTLGTGGLVAAAVLGSLFGAFGGAAGYTAHSARATSYLSDDPKACVNCHIMNEQYNSWSSSPHHARATCNDCHVPHDSVASKYLVKAEHGYRHSKGFTLQNFHEPIQITASSREVVIANCVRCHESMTHEIRTAVGSSPSQAGATGLLGSLGLTSNQAESTGAVDCIHCHAAVAHGQSR